MTHSTPQPVGDRLKHGPLSGQNLALLKAGDVLLDKHWGLMRFDRFDDSGRRAFLTGFADGRVWVLVPANMDFIGHDADGWIHAPEGGWIENPAPGTVGWAEADGGQTSLHNYSLDIVQDWSRVERIRFTTPATREDGASGADGEREVQYEVWQDGMMVAASTDPADAKHYLAAYGQDGPVVGRTAVTTRYDGFDARPLSPDQPSARERRLEEALERLEGAGSAVQSRLQQTPAVQTRDFHDVSIPFVNALNEARQALAHNQEGGR